MTVQRTFIHLQIEVKQDCRPFYDALGRALAELEKYQGNRLIDCDVQTVGVDEDD